MKSIHLLWLVATALVATACTSGDVLEDNAALGDNTNALSGEEINKVSITIPEFEFQGETRTTVTIDANGASFAWASDDAVGIFPDEGNQMKFAIKGATAGNTATFDGGGWGLKSAHTYYAYYPFSNDNFADEEAKSHLPVSYTGQSQTGNGNTAHLSAFDMMAAAGTSPAKGALNFQFAHLNALVQITLPAPAAATYKSLTLSASSPIFAESATVDLTASTPAIAATKLSNKLTLDLDVTATSAGEDLVFYMMLAPMDFSDVVVTLIDVDYHKTTFTLSSPKMVAGRAYAVTGSAAPKPEFVEFEDANLKGFMLYRYDKNKDDKISIAEAEAIDIIYVPYSVTSVAGIEYCVNAQNLTCQQNTLLTSLDLSGFTELKTLTLEDNTKLASIDLNGCKSLQTIFCRNNQLTSLDVSGFTALESLTCESNSQLTSLNISGCTALKDLSCGGNKLTSLDVSACTALQTLSCGGNLLTSLDVSACTALQTLSCGNNLLTTLDVSACTDLRSLDCSFNCLTSLDVSNNPALTYLKCSNNRLSSLNVNNCTALTGLYCSDNRLSKLNVSNCTALENLECHNNSLYEIDVKQNTRLLYISFYGSSSEVDLRNNSQIKYIRCYTYQMQNIKFPDGVSYTTEDYGFCININVSKL